MKLQLSFNTSKCITGKFTFRATPKLKRMQLLTEADKKICMHEKGHKSFLKA